MNRENTHWPGLSFCKVAPEDGGPSRSVPALALELARCGLEVEIVTCESDQNQKSPLLPQGDLVRTHLLPRSCRTVQWLAQRNGFTRALGAASYGVKDCMFHDNGVWLPTNHAVAFAARRLKYPLIISPRGMLTPWSMRFHGFKKLVAWFLYQKRDLRAAQVLHATSRQEAEEFRALGLTQPVAIIPNGVCIPLIGPDRSGFSISAFQLSAFKDVFRPPSSTLRTLLFLSRIHPKKGLLDLVEAWSLVQPKGWHVIIAGGDEGGHLEEVKVEIRKQKVESDFEFVGEVADEDKWDLYQSADLFVLPSHSENFGIVVAEALACGVPAIATQGTPWEDLVTHRCGWWPAVGPAPLAGALREALARSDEERRAMGCRGRQLVEAKYSWPAAAAQMISVYHWMLGHGPKPECVV